MISDLFRDIVTSYILTLILVSSSLFEPIRLGIKEVFPFLQIGINKHPIECRLCSGFWVSLFVCLFFNTIDTLLIVYGCSYFIATQERG